MRLTIMDDYDVSRLFDEDKHERSKVALSLWDSFDDHVGEALISHLVQETTTSNFQIACKVVIPKWMVRLQHRLEKMETWCFDGEKTKCLCYAIRGWRLPALEAQMGCFLNSDDLDLQLAAIVYCSNTLFCRREALRVANEFAGIIPMTGPKLSSLLRCTGHINRLELQEYIHQIIDDMSYDEQ